MYKCGFTYYLINLVDLVTFIKASKMEQISVAHETFKIEHLEELYVIKVLIFLYIILLTMNVTIFTNKNCAPTLINFHGYLNKNLIKRLSTHTNKKIKKNLLLLVYLILFVLYIHGCVKLNILHF